MSLTDQEIEELRKQFRAELESEHKQREQRAERKADRRKHRENKRSGRNREAEIIKAEVRSQFYEEHGYEEKLDPTGRRFYLSPGEIKNKQRKRRGKNKKSRNSQKDINQWYVYLIVAGMGILAALILVKSM